MLFRIKRGDTGPALVIGLSYTDGTTPNLAGATARMLFARRPGETPFLDAAATLDAVAHTATYDWSDGGTEVPARYYAEVEVTFADDGGVQTFPAKGYIIVVVTQDLG